MPSLDVRYDALLRPVHDNLLKNWDLSLCLYLDDFMSHLQEEANMNFSEAAMIVQNSTTFYCKRVDVVHRMIQEFVTEVCTTRESDKGEGGAGVKNGVKRKKQTRSLEMDDLQLLDFVASDHSLDGKIEKLTCGVLKQIVLCSAMKALRKSGTSMTVYQSTGTILGQKEEFRIFGKIYSDGTVNADINFDDGDKPLANVCDDSMDVDHGEFAEHDGIEIDGGFEALRDPQPGEMVVENPTLLAASMHKELSTQIPDMSTLDRQGPPETTVKEKCVPQRARNRKNGDWEPVPFEHQVRIKPIKVGSILAVPQRLLDEETKKKIPETNKRKRGGKKGKEEDDRDEDGKITWIDQAIRVGAVDVITFKIGLEKSKRDRIPATPNQPADIFVEPDEAMGPVADDEPGDFESFLDDHDLMTAAPLDRLDAMMRDDGAGDYADEALRAIEKFKENRRENASRATEVAKRVAAWHETLMPVLEDAEARSKFDVHEYGSRILSMFPDDDLETFRPFKDVVVGQPFNEICRYFLSSLMLANTYNLEIRKSDPAPLSKDCVELRLISKVRHHEEMDEAFRATSEDAGS